MFGLTKRPNRLLGSRPASGFTQSRQQGGGSSTKALRRAGDPVCRCRTWVCAMDIAFSLFLPVCERYPSGALCLCCCFRYLPSLCPGVIQHVHYICLQAEPPRFRPALALKC